MRLAARVKICGVTRVDDALQAARLGAEAIGLNFWPRSKRRVDPAVAKAIVAALPPFVVPVGVFVDQPADEIRRIAAEVGLAAVQLHGAETPEACRALALPVYKAFRCAARDADHGGPGAPWIEELESYADVIRGAVLDAAAPGYGGTGRACDWDLAREVATRWPVILAGGLTPDNVAAAVAAVRPWAVDVASGVESAPGVKDPELVSRFVRGAKETTP